MQLEATVRTISFLSLREKNMPRGRLYTCGVAQQCSAVCDVEERAKHVPRPTGPWVSAQL